MRLPCHLAYYFLVVPILLFMLITLFFVLLFEEINRKLVDKYPNACYNCVEKFSNQFQWLVDKADRLTK